VSDLQPEDVAVITRQLGRRPRGLLGVAHRCGCGQPDVVITDPRLPDGTPFPTVFYLTCPRLNSAIGTLEASGLMRDMESRLAADQDLAQGYEQAHQDYLTRRDRIREVPEVAGFSAGGMPTRVKCLHALVAHSLAVGAGVNQFGDEALDALGAWDEAGACARADTEQDDEQ